MRKRIPLGPYLRPMPRVLGGSWGKAAIHYGRGTPVTPAAPMSHSATWKGKFKLPWHKAGPINHIDDQWSRTSRLSMKNSLSLGAVPRS